MKEFSVFDPVLVRVGKYDRWTADFYDYPDDTNNNHWTVAGSLVADSDILPYNKETKHLHNNVGEFTKWKPKKGEPILVRDCDGETWTLCIFLEMCNGHFVCATDFEVIRSTYAWSQAKPYVNPFKE